MKEVGTLSKNCLILLFANQLPFMAKITFFAQIIQRLSKDLIKSLIKSMAQTVMPRSLTDWHFTFSHPVLL